MVFFFTKNNEEYKKERGEGEERKEKGSGKNKHF